MSTRFMLSLDHPETVGYIAETPMGLIPFENMQNGKHSLVVKGAKEMISTALYCREFYIYLTPISIEGIASYSLMTAFFDDSDEPIVMFTPLIDEGVFANDLFRILFSDKFYVHFFDELNIERLGFIAKSNIPESAKTIISNTKNWHDFSDVKEVYHQAHTWFAERTPDDDKAAIKISLQSELFPSDQVVIDLRQADTSIPNIGTTLERCTNPGDMQEVELAKLFRRVFPDDELFVGAFRIDKNIELADIIVVTPKSIVIVQAKDIENTKGASNKSVNKKILKSHNKLKAGLRQLSRAIKHVQRTGELALLDKRNDETKTFSTSGKTIYGLVIVPELFDYDYQKYSKPFLKKGSELDVLCLPLSFSQFADYTHNLEDEEAFIGGICQQYLIGKLRGEFPKLRFGYTDERS